MSFEPDFIWIVSKASAFGRSLASFTDDELIDDVINAIDPMIDDLLTNPRIKIPVAS